MKAAFPKVTDSTVILFGEGYGAKIQNGGAYRQDASFRLFDVRVGDWWLEPENIADVAQKLNISTVPVFGEIDFLPKSATDLFTILKNEGRSTVALEDGGTGCHAEGLVARTCPLLLTRRRDRLMWKLKFRDF